MKKALERMPTTIDDAFGNILERIGSSQGPDSARTALRTLTWVYRARRPLRMEELSEALVVEDGDHDPREDAINAVGIIDCCLSFITHDHTTGQVRFIHPSVERWFAKEPQHGKLYSECYLAKTCLTYLNFDAFNKQLEYLSEHSNDDNDNIHNSSHLSPHNPDNFDAFNLEYLSDDGNDNIDNIDNSSHNSSHSSSHHSGSHLRLSIDEEELSVQQHLICYPFHGYASHFWHDHMRNVEDAPKIQEMAFAFLQSETKRKLMSQIEKVIWFHWPQWRPLEDATVLHFAASFGLPTLCDILLNVRGRYPALLCSLINGQCGTTPGVYIKLAAR
jgi:hypothetical protein